jgi:guanylate kinase
LIIVISGPGGVGKGTLVTRLVARDDRLWLSRSWTTRARRPGEAPDAYTFVTQEAFEAKIADGGFLEWAPFLDYLQGTPMPDPPEGRDVVLEIDVQGARQVLDRHPGALLLFVDAPNRAEQRRRLEARGDPPEKVEQRLAIAESEADAARALGMRWIVNDDLERATDEVAAAIEAARGASG